ncbi:hypothetical protein [Thermoflexibacter ruber]|nr:hypothetical protein [Thermoflexibacter ruber]
MEKVSPLPTENAKKHTARVEEKPFLLRYENLHPQVKESFVYYDVENDFLHFSDPYIFEKVKMELTNKSNQELSAWENQFEGFTSLRSIYEQALLSEEERVKSSNLLFGAELPKEVKRDTSHTTFVNQHRNSFIFDSEGRYKMNIALYNVASFVNKDGIVKVANYFFQYSLQSIKIRKDDFSDKYDNLQKLKKGIGTVLLPISSSLNSGSISNGRTKQVVASDTEYTNLGLSWYYLGSPTGRISYIIEQYDYQIPIFGSIIGWNCFWVFAHLSWKLLVINLILLLLRILLPKVTTFSTVGKQWNRIIRVSKQDFIYAMVLCLILL